MHRPGNTGASESPSQPLAATVSFWLPRAQGTTFCFCPWKNGVQLISVCQQNSLMLGYKVLTATLCLWTGLGDCRGTRWKCSDDMCISSDLHCDKVPHCLDVSDETVNCSNSGLCRTPTYERPFWLFLDSTGGSFVPMRKWPVVCVVTMMPVWCFVGRLPSVYKCDSGGGAFPCVGRKWHERWFNVAIPMLIVLVLFLVAFILKIRNMICRPAESQGKKSRVC